MGQQTGMLWGAWPLRVNLQRQVVQQWGGTLVTASVPLLHWDGVKGVRSL